MADSLVFEIHGKLLRCIARSSGVHYQGLRGAASHLRRQRIITPGLAKQLGRVDDAFAVLRHISSVSSRALELELSLAMAASGSVDDDKVMQTAEFKEDAAVTVAELEARMNERFNEQEKKLLKAEVAAKQATETANEKVSELAVFKEDAELAYAGSMVEANDMYQALEAKLEKAELAAKQAAETANEKVADLAVFKEDAGLAYAGSMAEANDKYQALEAKLEKAELAAKQAAEAAGKQEQEKAAEKPKGDKFGKVDLELEALAQRINSSGCWEDESWRRHGWR
jgi:hypothetical protein